MAAVHPADGLPAGQTYHAAGPTEGGFLIVAMWDSKASADAFVSGVLMPAQPVAGGFEGAPVERTAEAVSILGA